MKDIIERLRIYGIKSFLYFSFNEFFNVILLGRIFKNSYSQYQEDLVIDKLLKYKNKGFYVDVGAYDPIRFSNTQRFYKKGWNGINIEPNPTRYKSFIKSRTRDINLNVGIGLKKTKMKFYKMIPDTLSTFSAHEVKSYLKQGSKLEEEMNVNILPLSKVFDTYCKNHKIDFISIDTEGFEMQVLLSNNWKKYYPKLICIESFTHSMKGNKKSNENLEIREFLEKKDYKRVYQNGTNVIYIHKSIKP